LSAWTKPADNNEEEPRAILDGDEMDMEEAWKTWTLMRTMKALGLPALPFSGGYMQQPEMLIDNVLRIERVAQAFEEQRHGG
jgi:hypothetical protein